VIYSPVKSLFNSANPSRISSYKIRKNNPLYFQHLRDPLASADSKATSTPLDSAVTRPLSLTPLESILTKTGEGGGGSVMACSLPACPERNRGERPMREVNQNLGPAALPSALRRVNRHSSRSCLTLASFIASLAKERNASPIFPVVCALFARNTRVVLVSLIKIRFPLRSSCCPASPFSETANRELSLPPVD